jgi:hypothetical protein
MKGRNNPITGSKTMTGGPEDSVNEPPRPGAAAARCAATLRGARDGTPRIAAQCWIVLGFMTMEKLRAGLLSATTPDAEKVDLLRELVARGNQPPVRDLLRAALACEANARVLAFVVRACGSLREKSLLPDIERHVSHADEVVAQNALKAAVALDPATAVRLAAPVIRTSRAELAWGFARILAQRCPAESRMFFLEIAQAPQAKDRVTSLVYLRSLPPDESAPIVVQMLQRESEADVAALLLKFLSKKLSRVTATPLENYARDLEGRLASAREVLAALPESLEPEPPRTTEPDELKDALSGDVTTALAHDFLDDAPLPPRLLVSPRQEPLRPQRQTGKGAARPPVAPPGHLQRGALAAAAVASLLLVFAFLRPPATDSRPGAASPASPSAAVGAPRPGSKVRFTGKVAEVRADNRSLRIEDEQQRSSWVQFLTLDVTTFAPGTSIVVEGIVKEIRADKTSVVHGFTATRL